jgi:WD40 repeat protein
MAALKMKDWVLRLSLSADGLTLAAGAFGGTPFPNISGDFVGLVRCWAYDAGSLKWIQLGQDLDGESPNDTFGASAVSLSSNGRIVAAGSRNHGDGAGQVRVFQYSEDPSQWMPLGQAIVGRTTVSAFGGYVSLSSDGFTVAGSGRSPVSLADPHVRIFTYNQGTNIWEQLGQDVEVNTDSLSLSADGRTLAVGNSRDGYVQVYKYNLENELWETLRQSILGDGDHDPFFTVELSDEGDTLVIGDQRKDNRDGQVRVFTV